MLVELLMKTGLSKNMPKTLVFMRKKEETTSVEIESATSLRQPEVSIAMQELRRRKWTQPLSDLRYLRRSYTQRRDLTVRPPYVPVSNRLDQGVIDQAKASKLAYICSILHRVLLDSDIEARSTALERKIQDREVRQNERKS